ncbi:hypothetical protein EJ05DRAFT_477196 [Pseudovirgaria hyperparasitica]|uniref:Uncharacterized protein n=1 Tax=Pseudovirgaria hyperparasitica TaxID=470096 RepID=A0A6A6W2Z7_9PEZI|nr:uncharacterized protein EJ05DRAFT_477196 [Pseudovirgaria hyperparasitica]KAF2756973.1 hypothetical protein EJ05DRAFT_477196 [Pseudovirgaria hyperparasitica]
MDPHTQSHPNSPERVTGPRGPFESVENRLPFSPSLPEFRGFKQSPSRTASDIHVQGMVARFNSLDIKDHKDLARRDEVAIKRSEMAREMAELELKKAKEEKDELERYAGKYREEARRLRKEVEEGRERERKVAKRLDVLMDELHRAKETTGQTQTVYEKEIRRARKEAFKSSSALVKMQEELKATRSSLKVTQSGLESERLRLSKREQEAFTAQYQLVAVQEELEKAHSAIKSVEEERDALKTSLKEEEVARIAAQGGIALPVSHSEEELDEFASPQKSPMKRPQYDSSDKENIMPKRTIELRRLQEELQVEASLRARAEEQIDFMKMECQFRCCSCRIADIQNTKYVHDNSLDTEMERIKASVPALSRSASDDEMEELMDPTKLDTEEFNPSALDIMPTTPADTDMMDAVIKDEPEEVDIDFAKIPDVHTTEEPAIEAVIDECNQDAVTSSPTPAITQPEIAVESPTSLPKVTLITKLRKEIEDDEDKENLPETPMVPAIRTITHTTTIPMRFSPAKADVPTAPSTAPHLPTRSFSERAPSTKSFNSSNENITHDLGKLEIDRTAALEAIRQRRGRARSIANAQMTPRKQMMEGVNERRDISAPQIKYGRP